MDPGSGLCLKSTVMQASETMIIYTEGRGDHESLASGAALNSWSGSDLHKLFKY